MRATGLIFAALLLWPGPAVGETALKSFEYYVGPYGREPGCRSLTLTTKDDKSQTLRVHGCEFTVVEKLPPDHPAAAFLEAVRKRQLGQTFSNAIGQKKRWLMIGALVDGRIVDSKAYVPNGFACAEPEGGLNTVTLEQLWEADGRDAGLGVSVGRYVPQDDTWVPLYDHGFNVAEHPRAPVVPCGDDTSK